MNPESSSATERTLILAPRGRDAAVGKAILRDGGLRADICVDLRDLVQELERGADVAVLAEEATRENDVGALAQWIQNQPAWSDFPFIVLTEHGGGLERNPAARRLIEVLGNVTFLERPFHATTMISIVQSSLRGRKRQYECRRLNDELEMRVRERTAELAAANRQLLQQIEEKERVELTLHQVQRLEAVGQLTSGVAHDFNNLLTVVLGNIAFLERELQASASPKAMQRLGYMRSAAERGAKLTSHLLSFSRRQHLDSRPLDLNETVRGMRELLRSTIGATIQVETRLSTGLWRALADPTQLELAILNLAINARDAMPVGGAIWVETFNVTLGHAQCPEEPPAGDYVAVCVADSGTGIPAEVRAKVFEPFFTTKDVGKGSGLGLSQVLGFAKQSGGGVRIESEPGRGTRVHIYLPRTEMALYGDAGVSAVSARAVHPGARILVVDDDDAVRQITVSVLEDLGYEVVEAGSSGAALELLESEAPIHLLVIDFVMPGMNGAELARRVKTRRPALPLVFVTGYADRAALAGISETFIIGKPFTSHELADKVSTALAAAPAARVVSLKRA